MRIDRRLCIAARSLVGISRKDLALKAHLSVPEIQRYENGHPIHFNHEGAIRAALEHFGVQFIVHEDGRDSIRRARNGKNAALTAIQ